MALEMTPEFCKEWLTADFHNASFLHMGNF